LEKKIAVKPGILNGIRSWSKGRFRAIADFYFRPPSMIFAAGNNRADHDHEGEEDFGGTPKSTGGTPVPPEAEKEKP
jgi:hypothetical protein